MIGIEECKERRCGSLEVSIKASYIRDTQKCQYGSLHDWMSRDFNTMWPFKSPDIAFTSFG